MRMSRRKKGTSTQTTMIVTPSLTGRKMTNELKLNTSAVETVQAEQGVRLMPFLKAPSPMTKPAGVSGERVHT